MGQPVVVENKGGASGTIGQAQVAQAAPDGYTIMIHSSSHTVSPPTFAKLPFDTAGRLRRAVTPISSTPNVLVISPAKNIKTLQELLAATRQARQDEFRFRRPGQRHPPQRREVQAGREDRRHRTSRSRAPPKR